MAIINDDVTGATDIDRVSQAITYVFESQGRFLPLMYAMIDRELVQHNTNEGTLFRGNTVATTSWKFYSKLVGLEYLWNTLSDDIYLLVEKTSSGEISTEVSHPKSFFMTQMTDRVEYLDGPCIVGRSGRR
jgi:hypothetical protein